MELILRYLGTKILSNKKLIGFPIGHVVPSCCVSNRNLGHSWAILASARSCKHNQTYLIKLIWGYLRTFKR